MTYGGARIAGGCPNWSVADEILSVARRVNEPAFTGDFLFQVADRVHIGCRVQNAHARGRRARGARVISDQGRDDPPGRNPAYPVFGACADFPELRQNFVKLIRQSPGIDAVPGSNLLDTLEAIEQVGREYDGCRNERLPDEPGGREDGGNEAPERPMRFLDVAADFIAVSLIRGIPDLEVPVRLQQEWLDMLDPCARVRTLNAFVVEALDDMMSPDRIYARALQARIKRYERVLVYRGDDPRKELLRSNGDEFLQQTQGPRRTALRTPGSEGAHTRIPCRAPPEA